MQSCYRAEGLSSSESQCSSKLNRLISIFSGIVGGDEASAAADYDDCRAESASSGSNTQGCSTVGRFNLGRVALSGTFKDGYTIRAKTSGWKGSPLFDYLWYVNGRKQVEEFGSTYVIKSSDVGKKITVKAIAGKSCYLSRAVTAKSPTIRLAPKKKMPFLAQPSLYRRDFGGSIVDLTQPAWIGSGKYDWHIEWYINGVHDVNNDDTMGWSPSINQWDAGGVWDVRAAYLVSRPGYKNTRVWSRPLLLKHSIPSWDFEFGVNVELTGTYNADSDETIYPDPTKILPEFTFTQGTSITKSSYFSRSNSLDYYDTSGDYHLGWYAGYDLLDGTVGGLNTVKLSFPSSYNLTRNSFNFSFTNIDSIIYTISDVQTVGSTTTVTFVKNVDVAEFGWTR
jgi:hypothetical protein